MRALAAGVLLLLIAGVGPAAAQPASSLRATMLGTMDDGRWAVDGGRWTVGSEQRLSSAHPLFSSSVPRRAAAPSLSPDTTRHDPWLGRDKVLHAAGSFLLTLSGQYVLTSKLGASEHGAWPVSAGATLSLGLAKEIADSRRPVRPAFSVRDLAADAFGVALAVGLILL